jgi:hypothetical protein
MLIVPFAGTEEHLEFYSLLVPFLFFHWTTNDDTCALTQLEAWFTGKDKYDTFMGRVMSPIYNVDDHDASYLIKVVFFFLWIIVQFRLGRIDVTKLLRK